MRNQTPKEVKKNAAKHSSGAPHEGEPASSAYLRALPELKRYISVLLPHAARSGEVEDIAQEVFARAYAAKKNEKLQHGKAFLFKIARNLSFNLYKKRKRNVEEVVEDFVLEGVISSTPNAEDQLFQRQRLKALTDAMSHLPQKRRDAFFLRHFEGLSHKEIGARMDISVSTVEKHLSKALQQISRDMRAVGCLEDDDAAAPKTDGDQT